jgi:hypothetical protein
MCVNTVGDILACEGGQLTRVVPLDLQGGTTKSPNDPARALGRAGEKYLPDDINSYSVVCFYWTGVVFKIPGFITLKLMHTTKIRLDLACGTAAPQEWDNLTVLKVWKKRKMMISGRRGAVEPSSLAGDKFLYL